MFFNFLVILFVCFVANSIATISGFGLATILTPVLLLFFPIKEVIVVVCIVHLFHDIWKLIFFHKKIDVKLTVGFGIAAFIASIISSLLFIYWYKDFSFILGIFLLGYAVILFFRPQFKLKRNWFVISISGLITGLTAGFFGIVGAIRSMFLLSFGIDKQAFIATSALISFLINSARFATYMAGGISLNQQLVYFLPFLILVSFLGTYLGRYLVIIIPLNIFKKIVLIFVIIMALKLIIMPFLSK